MTLLEKARSGKITAEINTVALYEGLEPEYIRKGLAEGTIVIPKNATRRLKTVRGIGKGLRTKVNANIGSSPYHIDIDEYVSVETGVTSFEEDFFTSDELYKVLNELPTGYRMVFNLYAVEGYKHKEIADMLSIDTNTSKSQYSRAKAVIRDKLEKLRALRKSYPGNV